MKLLKLISLGAGIVLVMALLPVLNAQTVISNEKLVSTTLVVTKEPRHAGCDKPDCKARVAMFDPISITCPGTSGQTCTIHILVDAKVAVTNFPSFYQFLIDDAAPTIGPTGKNGGYTFRSGSSDYGRVSVPASVVGTVTNSNSDTHTIAINIGCAIELCHVDSNASTVRIDIFQP